MGVLIPTDMGFDVGITRSFKLIIYVQRADSLYTIVTPRTESLLGLLVACTSTFTQRSAGPWSASHGWNRTCSSQTGQWKSLKRYPRQTLQIQCPRRSTLRCWKPWG